MLFKTNTNGHKHPSISLFIIEQDTILLGKPNKTTSGIQHMNCELPKNSLIDCDGVQLHQYWTTLPVYGYTSYNQNSYKECIRIYKYILTRDGNKGHQEETHRPTHRFRRLFLDLLLIGWRWCARAMGVIKLPPFCSSPKLRKTRWNGFFLVP